MVAAARTEVDGTVADDPLGLASCACERLDIGDKRLAAFRADFVVVVQHRARLYQPAAKSLAFSIRECAGPAPSGLVPRGLKSAWPVRHG